MSRCTEGRPPQRRLKPVEPRSPMPTFLRRISVKGEERRVSVWDPAFHAWQFEPWQVHAVDSTLPNTPERRRCQHRLHTSVVTNGSTYILLHNLYMSPYENPGLLWTLWWLPYKPIHIRTILLPETGSSRRQIRLLEDYCWMLDGYHMNRCMGMRLLILGPPNHAQPWYM